MASSTYHDPLIFTYQYIIGHYPSKEQKNTPIYCMNTDLVILLQILEECLRDSPRFSNPIFFQVQIINPTDPEPADQESFNQATALNFKIQGIKPIYFVLRQKTEITFSCGNVQRTYFICDHNLTTLESVRQTLNNQILPPTATNHSLAKAFKHNVYYRTIIP